MTTTMEIRTQAYSRPAASFDADGNLEIRASALGHCRRALWYTASGQAITNPVSDESLTIMEAGNALEPVVLRAMQRAGWDITPADSARPLQVSVLASLNLTVTGHPDATGTLPLFGGEAVIEVKTRGPEAFKRWQVLGAERSHPESVWQAAAYTLGVFGEMRDAVIATLDTGNRAWDYEVIPAHRLERAWRDASDRLGELADHLELYGPDPSVLPERDFDASDWRCKRCPFLNVCNPGDASIEPEPVETTTDTPAPVSDDEAREALREYEELQDTIREFEDEKRWVTDTLRAWLSQQGKDKAKLEGREKSRTIGMVKSTRYSVDYKGLNTLLDPQARAEVVTERVSEYLRVS